ncbi:kinesin family protein [Penicillium brasilianum]|uniref:Kinesin family protein n=1 Tax=Penicillium brasilianum TaxID=104259 RepID=A0A1S9RNP8_PENBI|nr:kinesin family protein [Penicillium brasilianum]
MSVRVVARVRPLLKSERDLDVILRTGASAGAAETKSRESLNGDRKLAALRDRDNVVRIPNPKNEGEEYTFQFNAVYDADVTQQELFDAEVAPTIKHLFNGFDITLFAYGVTGTGKTHTMRGGKSLAERGVIPRLLSGIYRRSRKMEKDSNGETTVQVSLSYYEIYNDKVYDLFEPPEKRTLAGLPLRDNGGKTVVCGLTEKACTSLKEFEGLYDQANTNRSTSATKLNAHSSRSHAILGVKVTVTTPEKTRVSTASAIDLAGSEDNRRTENDKERMVESASINKSLFVLAQCVEAITKKQHRIPYRESKMTRILSLGQNNGLTVMILNLAPVRSYHLDTISSLSVANRTRKIEVREVENDPIFKGPARPAIRPSLAATRKPLQPLTASVHVNMPASVVKDPAKKDEDKPLKAFSVYSDRTQAKAVTQIRNTEIPKKTSLSETHPIRTLKPPRPSIVPPQVNYGDICAAKIEEMVEKKVEEILAVRAVSEQSRQTEVRELNEQLQRRLEQLEQRIEGTEDARAEGLSYLLMAKQHQARGENSSALRMYQLALPHFPHNQKLASKIAALKERLHGKTQARQSVAHVSPPKGRFGSMLSLKKEPTLTLGKRQAEDFDNTYMGEAGDGFSSDEDDILPKPKKRATSKALRQNGGDLSTLDECEDPSVSPRTVHLLSIINSRDVSQIKLLKGVGAKKAEAIVDCLCEMDQAAGTTDEIVSDQPQFQVGSLAELSTLKGVGVRTVENMRSGVLV